MRWGTQRPQGPHHRQELDIMGQWGGEARHIVSVGLDAFAVQGLEVAALVWLGSEAHWGLLPTPQPEVLPFAE